MSLAGFGITPAGFRRPTFSQVIEDLKSRIRAKPGFGQKAALTEDFPEGQIAGVMADVLDQQWGVHEGCFNSLWESSSEGNRLDAVCQLIGVFRLKATYTITVAILQGDAGETIPAGIVAQTDDTGDYYEMTAPVLLSGTGSGTGIFVAVETGARSCLAGRLNIIITGDPHLSSVVNLVDGVPGRLVEEDADLRARRHRTLQAAGASTTHALEAALLQEVANVTDAYVVENDTDYPDADGRPMKSVEAMVYGGVHDDIADKIWEHKAGGIGYFGNTECIKYDSRSRAQTFYYSRPVETDPWFHVKIVVGPEFNQGTQHTLSITINTDTDGDYEVTVNEFTFTHAAVGETKAQIAAALVVLIEAGISGALKWTPLTVPIVVDGVDSNVMHLECEYPGVPLVITVDEDKMTLDEEVACTGDQQTVITNMVTFGFSTQLINTPIRRYLYFEPVGDVDNIWGAEIYLDVTPVPIVTDNIDIPLTGDTSGKAIVLSTRITVEIVGSL